MLVIRRRVGQAIVLAENIEIEVIEISRTKVKLGVRAPRSVTVYRREAAVLAQENQSAAALLATSSGTVADLLRLLGNIAIESAKVIPVVADM